MCSRASARHVPADCVERAPLAALEQRHAVQRLAHDLLGFFHRALGEVLQRKTAERKRHAAADALSAHIDEFERAATEIAHDTVRLMQSRDDTERGILRLLLAGEHRDVLAADALRRSNELRTVVGVAAGSRGNAPYPLHARGVAQRAEAAQRIERLLHRVGGEQPGRLHLASEAGEDLLVEDRGRRARQPLVDHEAHRVRADVDDGDRGAVVQAALRDALARAT